MEQKFCSIKKSTYIYTFKERNDSFDIKISINKDKNMSNLLQKNQRSEFKSTIQIFDRILGILHILILWGGNLVTVECHPAYLGDLPTSIFGFELFQKASRTMLRFVKCSSTKVLIKEGEFLGTCFVVIPPFHQRMVLFLPLHTKTGASLFVIKSMSKLRVNFQGKDLSKNNMPIPKT